ncbi:MAG: hypothetical protein MZV63_57395 [Marinilabiliales bacterium]|nr:hypothetical protein [Marinilabiliales bacterium]
MILMVLFLAVSGFSAFKVLENYSGGVNDKNLVLETNAKYEKTLFSTVTDADLNVGTQW